MMNEGHKKIFVSRIIPDSGINLLTEAGFFVDIWPEDRPIPQDVFIQRAGNADALICLSADTIDSSFLTACSHLEIISQFAAGYDNIDIAAATKLRIPVGNTPGAMSNATADIAFGLMIGVSRKMFYMFRTIEKGEWSFFRPMAHLGMELKNKTLGIFGLGTIGLEMARRCKGAYEMDIIYCNRNRNATAERLLGARYVSFEELLEESDVLSVHSVLSAQTKGVFNRTAFEKMKSTSIFINTSRGGVHNEIDLIHALKNGTIWGAGLDVTNPEPMHKDNPLLQMENVCVLPHIGSATLEARSEMSRMAAENIVQFYKTGRFNNIVNAELLP